MPLDDLGQPQIVGPHSPAPSHMFRPLRTLGYRKVGDKLVPLLHTKLMLLGELTWMEDEEFGLGGITRFQPKKLWIGSANGTFSSRFNLEMGCWCRRTPCRAERGTDWRAEGGWSAVAGAEELLAVVVAGQEGEAGQVGAQLGEVVALGAGEAAE